MNISEITPTNWRKLLRDYKRAIGARRWDAVAVSLLVSIETINNWLYRDQIPSKSNFDRVTSTLGTSFPSRDEFGNPALFDSSRHLYKGIVEKGTYWALLKYIFNTAADASAWIKSAAPAASIEIGSPVGSSPSCLIVATPADKPHIVLSVSLQAKRELSFLSFECVISSNDNTLFSIAGDLTDAAFMKVYKATKKHLGATTTKTATIKRLLAK